MFGEYGKEKDEIKIEKKKKKFEKDEIKFGKDKLKIELKIEYLDISEGNELKVVDPWEVLWN